MLTLILPATAGLFVLAAPIVALVFERGQFTPTNTEITANVLRVYLFGLPFAAVDQMLVFASYARKDTLRPALVGVVAIGVYLATAVLLIRPLGLYSLMVADAVKHIVHTLIMIWLLNRSLDGLRGLGLVTSALKSLVAALAAGGAAYAILLLLGPILLSTSLFSRILLVLLGGLAGMGGYIALVYALDIQAAKSLPRLLRKKAVDS